MIRLLLADDHNLFRELLLTMLNSDSDITVVAEAEDGASLISKYNENKPDIILSDISMPGKSGPDAIRSIARKDKLVKVLFLSQHTGDDYIYSVIQAGGSGLVSKNIMRSELLLAIKTVARGKRYFVGKTEEELKAIKKRFNLIKAKERKGNVGELTKKEKEILLLVSENISSQDIADKLKLSIRTIESHRLNIIQKLHLKSLPGLIGYARDYARQHSE